MAINYNNIKIGADPEVFLTNKKEFISAHGVIPGTKQNPHKVKKGAVQVDGMALEFNIDPATDITTFINNIAAVENQLKEMIPRGTRIKRVPTATFSKDIIKNQPKEALELGCDPDFNAYTGKTNARPKATRNTLFRTGAGHIHIGWCVDKDITNIVHFNDCRLMSMQLDYFLGIESLLWDDDYKRRQLYGKAGAFRPKSYGMEYRVLSNAWLNKNVKERVFNRTLAAFNALNEGYLFKPTQYEKNLINGKILLNREELKKYTDKVNIKIGRFL